MDAIRIPFVVVVIEVVVVLDCAFNYLGALPHPCPWLIASTMTRLFGRVPPTSMKHCCSECFLWALHVVVPVVVNALMVLCFDGCSERCMSWCLL